MQPIHLHPYANDPRKSLQMSESTEGLLFSWGKYTIPSHSFLSATAVFFISEYYVLNEFTQGRTDMPHHRTHHAPRLNAARVSSLGEEQLCSLFPLGCEISVWGRVWVAPHTLTRLGLADRHQILNEPRPWGYNQKGLLIYTVYGST